MDYLHRRRDHRDREDTDMGEHRKPGEADTGNDPKPTQDGQYPSPHGGGGEKTGDGR
jgi:hypothetical protein